MKTESILLSREELYELVWSEAMQVLAKRFGLSDVGLAKVCKRHNIPRPPRGYWAKQRAGHRVKKTPLPKAKDDTNEPITFRSQRPTGGGCVSEESTEVSKIREFESSEENRILVPGRVTRYHYLLRETRKSLTSSSYDRYPRKYSHGDKVVEIKVGTKSATRAVKILDALIKALAHRGYPMHFGGENARGLFVEIFDENMKLGIREPMKRIEHVPTRRELVNKERHGWEIYTKYDYIPSGNLVLDVNGEKYRSLDASVRDTKSKKLEERLNEFVVRLANAAYENHQRRLKREEEWRLQEIKREQHEERERQRKEAERRRQLLLEEAGRYSQAAELRAYISAVQEKQEPGDENLEMTRWTTWALKIADRLDPTVNGYTEIESKLRYSW